MKIKKILSTVMAVAMVSSAFLSIAHADATITFDEDYEIYRIADFDGVLDRTPYIDVLSVKQMTSAEIVALGTAKTSSLSALKLTDKSGKYGDATTHKMFQIDATFKNVGDLVMGYDAEDNSAAIQLMALDASFDVSTIDKVVDVGYAKVTDPTTNVTWSGGWNKSENIMLVNNQLGTDNAIPKEDTAEGGIINAEYPFTIYIVVEDDAAVSTVSFVKAASVQYRVCGEMKENQVGNRSETFTLGSATEPDPELPELVENQYVFSFDADEETDIKIINSRTGDKTYDLPDFVKGTMKVWGLLKFSGNEDVQAGDTFTIKTAKNRVELETIRTITVQAADLQ